MVRRCRLALFFLVVSTLFFAPTRGADAAPGKRVTRVLIQKDAHSMRLFAAGPDGREELVASYKVAIGPGGSGPKRREGDMTTPVGRYHITAHQPSQYKVFLRLDYPTAADYARFAALKARGDLPASARIGGDIGIHGPPVALAGVLKSTLKLVDWTAGCIAVDEDEIAEVARLVRDGTVVDIEE
jgi:murein L,D-transpeptidase YafK